MAGDRRAGVGKQVTGSIKGAIGSLAGDRETRAQGSAEKAAGKAADGETNDIVVRRPWVHAVNPDQPTMPVGQADAAEIGHGYSRRDPEPAVSI